MVQKQVLTVIPRKDFKHRTKYKRPDKFEHRFLNAIDIDQGKIKVQITRMFRLRGTDWSTDKKEKKEYLVWESNWYAKNWLGSDLAVMEHLEGRYKEQTKVLQWSKPDATTGRVEAYYIKGVPRGV